jgi:hypothetical protein
MKRLRIYLALILFVLPLIVFPRLSSAWHDETHIAIAKIAGYHKWFNAAGPDMIKIKAEEIEKNNHYVNNPPATVITPEMVLAQTERYDQRDPDGHLYGAIIASLRDYFKGEKKQKYDEYHLAFCAHYVGDLSNPFHNTLYNSFNRKYHKMSERMVNVKILDSLNRIKIYPIVIDSEETLAKEIARIANLSLKLGYKIESENRLLTQEEGYEQISHSASLFKGILGYVEMRDKGNNT